MVSKHPLNEVPDPIETVRSALMAYYHHLRFHSNGPLVRIMPDSEIKRIVERIISEIKTDG